VAHKLAGVGSRWPRATLAACAALLVISVIGFTQTKAWFPLYQNLPDDSATIAINDAISDEFGGVFTMIVETDEDWPQTQTLTKTLQDISGPQTVLSEVSLATTLTIAFGIAIDDSVHFLSRFSAAKARGEPSKTAVVSATNAAGQVIVLTTLLLTIGMSVTMISGFTPIRLFGGMMIVTLWAALLIDLLLLPALLTWKRTSQVLG